MMENYGDQLVRHNPNEPYLATPTDNPKVNFSNNDFAIGHRSLTNDPEIAGGSNFGVDSDNAPDWGHRAQPSAQCLKGGGFG
jgi:hypothetical protein